MRKREQILEELLKYMEMLEIYKEAKTDSMFSHCEDRIHFLRWVLCKEEKL